MNKVNITGLNMVLDNDTIRKNLEFFVDNILPHGGGINYDWSISAPKNGRYVYFKNRYDIMSEYGIYIGYQDFSVKVDRFELDYILAHWHFTQPSATETAVYLLRKMATDFTLQFNGLRHFADYYGLRDYLEDTIYYCLQYAADEKIKEGQD